MTENKLPPLIKPLLKYSETKVFDIDALRNEWDYIGYIFNKNNIKKYNVENYETNKCICKHPIEYHILISNKLNGTNLIIGNTCVNILFPKNTYKKHITIFNYIKSMKNLYDTNNICDFKNKHIPTIEYFKEKKHINTDDYNFLIEQLPNIIFENYGNSYSFIISYLDLKRYIKIIYKILLPNRDIRKLIRTLIFGNNNLEIIETYFIRKKLLFKKNNTDEFEFNYKTKQGCYVNYYKNCKICNTYSYLKNHDICNKCESSKKSCNNCITKIYKTECNKCEKIICNKCLIEHNEKNHICSNCKEDTIESSCSHCHNKIICSKCIDKHNIEKHKCNNCINICYEFCYLCNIKLCKSCLSLHNIIHKCDISNCKNLGNNKCKRNNYELNFCNYHFNDNMHLDMTHCYQCKIPSEIKCDFCDFKLCNSTTCKKSHLKLHLGEYEGEICKIKGPFYTKKYYDIATSLLTENDCDRFKDFIINYDMNHIRLLNIINTLYYLK